MRRPRATLVEANTQLETKFRSQLNAAWQVTLRCNLSEFAAGWRCIWSSKRWMVQCVEGLSSQLEPDRAKQRKLLINRGAQFVNSILSRTGKGVGESPDMVLKLIL